MPPNFGAADGGAQYIDSDGNHVYVGYFDADGLNVNNNWDDNRNVNIGVASARQSSLPLEIRMPTTWWAFV